MAAEFYTLPQERIAQRPIAVNRARSKLLHATVAGGQLTISDRTFSELPELLDAGDLIVINDTKVLPWRFFPAVNRFGLNSNGAGAPEVELLLLGRMPGEEELWNALARPMRKLKEGDRLALNSELTAVVRERVTAAELSGGDSLAVELIVENSNRGVEELLRIGGVMPIPPYIRGGQGDDADCEQYQTVYGVHEGSVAAPTAGLHFTEQLFADLASRGVETAKVTLHLGPGSFRPVQGEVADHVMASERYTVPRETFKAIQRCQNRGGRVVAVGTSVVRTLESFFRATSDRLEKNVDRESATDMFITPGYNFKAIDILVTNFHQPRSTHLLLVAAFAGEGATREIYRHALESGYRFLSYGDSSVIFRDRR